MAGPTLAGRSGSFSQIDAGSISYFDMYGPILIGTLMGVFVYALVVVRVAILLPLPARPDADAITGCGTSFNAPACAQDASRSSCSCSLLIRPYARSEPGVVLLCTATTLAGCARSVKLFILHPGDKDYFLDLHRRREVFIERLLACLTCNVGQAFMVMRIVRFSQSMRSVRMPSARGAPSAPRRAASGLGARVAAGARGAKALALRCLFAPWFAAVLVVVLGLQLLLCVASGLAFSIYLGTLDSWTALEASDGQVVGTYSLLLNKQCVSFMVLDGMITVLSLWFFGRAKTGFGASDKVLNSMIFIIIRTGALTTIAQIGQLMTYHLTTTTWCETTPLFIGQMFSTSVLAILIEPRQAHADYYRRQLAWAADGGGGATSAGASAYCPACAQPLSAPPSARATGLDAGFELGGLGGLGGVARPRKTPYAHAHAHAHTRKHDGLLTFAAALTDLDDDCCSCDELSVSVSGGEVELPVLLAEPLRHPHPTYAPCPRAPSPYASLRSAAPSPYPATHTHTRSSSPSRPGTPSRRPPGPATDAAGPALAADTDTGAEWSAPLAPYERAPDLRTAGVDLGLDTDGAASEADAARRAQIVAERGLARADSMPLTAATVEMPVGDGAERVSMSDVLRSNLFW
ncbi:hypothetical protein Q5752_005459 [Cryptotrichosporon argae]